MIVAFKMNFAVLESVGKYRHNVGRMLNQWGDRFSIQISTGVALLGFYIMRFHVNVIVNAQWRDLCVWFLEHCIKRPHSAHFNSLNVNFIFKWTINKVVQNY